MTDTQAIPGSEFPDYHQRQYIINGKTVGAYTITHTEGGREVISAVGIKTDAATQKIIGDTLRAKNRFSITTRHPVTKESGGFYITDPQRMVSAAQILDNIDGELRYLSGKNSFLQPSPKTANTDAMSRLTHADDARIQGLLQAVYNALDNAYGCSRIEEKQITAFMENTRRILSFDTVKGAFTLPAEKTASPVPRKTIIVMRQLSNVIVRLQGMTKSFGFEDYNDAIHQRFCKSLQAELRNAVRNYFAPVSRLHRE